MKKLMPFVAVMFVALSIGTTMARADGDGGETGADRAHTQSYSSYYQAP